MGTNMNLGSISTICYNNVDSVPTGISGNIIVYADQAVNFVESWTGNTIGSVTIIPQYQPAIIAFTMNELCKNLQNANGGVESASIEGINATKAYGKQAEMWQKIGQEHLKAIGKAARYYKVLE